MTEQTELKPKRRTKATPEELNQQIEEKRAEPGFVSPIRDYPPVDVPEPFDGIDLTEEAAEIFKDVIRRDTLNEKIVLVMDAIDAVEKKGRNEAQRYDYQRATDVTREVRREFIKHGLVFTTDLTDIDVTHIPRERGAPVTLVTLKGTFTITDGFDKISFGGIGMGQDVGDKGIYKAITGMLKYGLRTLLLLPDEKDDPEAARQDEFPEGGNISIESSSVEGLVQGGRSEHITGAQIDDIRKRARKLDMDPADLATIVGSVTDEPIDLSGLDETASQIKFLMDQIKTLSFEHAAQVIQLLMAAETSDD